MRLTIWGFAAALASSCLIVPGLAGQGQSTSVRKGPSAFDDDPEISAREEARAADRRLVTGAPKGFKPQGHGRILSLRLIARDAKIRVGETFWFRLELQNVGTSVVSISESDSFLKSGTGSSGMLWRFSVVTPKGDRWPMIIGREEVSSTHPSRRVVEIPGSAAMSEKEVRDFIRRNDAWRRADSELDVILGPGQTLSTRPWKWDSKAEFGRLFINRAKREDPRQYGGFRELWTEFRFDEPGIYEISVVRDDPPPPPPTEEYLREMERRGVSRESSLEMHRKRALDVLGRVTSNSVSIEVVR